jgi:hypothetical protein
MKLIEESLIWVASIVSFIDFNTVILGEVKLLAATDSFFEFLTVVTGTCRSGMKHS